MGRRMPVVIREEAGNREEGQDNQQSSQSLPRPGSAISHQPPSDGQRNRPGGNKNGCLEVARFIVEVLTFIIGFATLIALLFYVKATYHQVHEMRKANRIARDALALSERPWVGIGPIAIQSKPTEGESLLINLAIVNGGKSPAIHTSRATVFKPLAMAKEDLSVPLIDDPALVECKGPKPKWSDDLGGMIIMPGATHISFEQKSPVLRGMFLDIITGKIK